MKTVRTLLWIAAGLLVGGVVLGFMPTGGDCGSAFNGAVSLSSGGCDMLNAQARQLPVLLLIMGAAVFAAGGAVHGGLTPAERASAKYWLTRRETPPNTP